MPHPQEVKFILDELLIGMRRRQDADVRQLREREGDFLAKHALAEIEAVWKPKVDHDRLLKSINRVILEPQAALWLLRTRYGAQAFQGATYSRREE